MKTIQKPEPGDPVFGGGDVRGEVVSGDDTAYDYDQNVWQVHISWIDEQTVDYVKWDFLCDQWSLVE